MESLCAYDSSSSSDDNDESPKNKKRRVSSTEIDIVNGRGSELILGQREDLKPSIKPSNARGTLAANVSALKQMLSYSASNYRSGLSDCFSGDHKTSSQACLQTRKTPSFIGSVVRKTHTKSSSSGPSVKPYVSKREREKIAQENALITASTISANHPLQEIGCHNPLESVESKSEPTKTETASFKTTYTDLQCSPPKKLHLNLEGHSQGVNCVRWNPVRSNLLISASMDHVVCVWDIHKSGVCTQRFARHSEAVKDSRWSLCGSQVLTCGYDKTARLFNLETGSYNAPISSHPRGVDPGNIQGNSVGFPDFCHQFLARDRGTDKCIIAVILSSCIEQVTD